MILADCCLPGESQSIERCQGRSTDPGHDRVGCQSLGANVTKRSTALIGFLSMLLGCAPQPDREAIRGDWQRVQMHGGFDFGLPLFKLDSDFILSFDNDTFSYITSKASNQIVKGTFECNESTNPKQITFTYGNKTVVGIYTLSNDRLRICVGMRDDVAPSSFFGGPQSRPALMDFSRMK